MPIRQQWRGRGWRARTLPGLWIWVLLLPPHPGGISIPSFPSSISHPFSPHPLPALSSPPPPDRVITAVQRGRFASSVHLGRLSCSNYFQIVARHGLSFYNVSIKKFICHCVPMSNKYRPTIHHTSTDGKSRSICRCFIAEINA